MKPLLLLIVCHFVLISSKSQNHDTMKSMDSITKDFRGERTTRSASITLKGAVEEVFPLFTPELEKRWTPNWNYIPVYMNIQSPKEYDVFLTHAHVQIEGPATWVIAKLDTSRHIAEYMVFTKLRVGIINISCEQTGPKQTKASITYSFTGLTPEGNDLCKRMVNKMYAKNMQDWEEDINNYLRSAGK